MHTYELSDEQIDMVSGAGPRGDVYNAGLTIAVGGIAMGATGVGLALSLGGLAAMAYALTMKPD